MSLIISTKDMSSPIGSKWTDLLQGPLLERPTGWISFWGVLLGGVVIVLNSETTWGLTAGVEMGKGADRAEVQKLFYFLIPLLHGILAPTESKEPRALLPVHWSIDRFLINWSKLQENSEVLGKKRKAGLGSVILASVKKKKKKNSKGMEESTSIMV